MAVVDLDLTWQDQAACRGRWDLFFPPANERPNRRASREAQARALCASGPVMQACDEYATAAGESHHIWAGIDRETPFRSRRLAVRSSKGKP